MNFEQRKTNKYEIKKENIIALDDLPQNFSKKLRSLNWPLEVQGTGRILEDSRNFEIRYPRGDLFYSWAVIIHELGHLRQDEFNKDIRREKNETEKNLKKEKDAFTRGMGRVKKYYPDILDKLEAEFKNFKENNKIPAFNSFMDLYNDFSNVIKINEAMGSGENDDLKYRRLKAINITEFFKNIENNKVGVKIDTSEAENVILKVTNEIAGE
ncbi:MAG: hypothetical protein PHD51_01205 [Patescibacteria group bacterium]|nr:hypothetical protein [Patescibacteria group bacterium]MDD5490522.1 hypothetical protein [Patescibacteria group bacterium]